MNAPPPHEYDYGKHHGPLKWRDVEGTEFVEFAELQRRARAVIAAGRPNHLHCPCPQCAAWDALEALLEP